MIQNLWRAARAAALPRGPSRSIQIAKTVDAGDGRVDIQVSIEAAALPAGAESVEFVVDYNYGGTPDIHYFPETGLNVFIPCRCG